MLHLRVGSGDQEGGRRKVRGSGQRGRMREDQDADARAAHCASVAYACRAPPRARAARHQRTRCTHAHCAPLRTSLTARARAPAPRATRTPAHARVDARMRARIARAARCRIARKNGAWIFARAARAKWRHLLKLRCTAHARALTYLAYLPPRSLNELCTPRTARTHAPAAHYAAYQARTCCLHAFTAHRCAHRCLARRRAAAALFARHTPHAGCTTLHACMPAGRQFTCVLLRLATAAASVAPESSRCARAAHRAHSSTRGAAHPHARL